jgi:hypothetical protein
MKAQKERTELIPRRRILIGSAMLLAGGIVGRISDAAIHLAFFKNQKPTVLRSNRNISFTFWNRFYWQAIEPYGNDVCFY